MDLMIVIAIIFLIQKRLYLPQRVNSLFSLKGEFMGTSVNSKEKLSIKNDDGGGRIIL